MLEFKIEFCRCLLDELESFRNIWDSKYPKIYKSWYENWATLSTYFKYPEAVRRLIHTTNAIEGFNRQLRKVTKSKTIFPSDDSLLKMLYREGGADKKLDYHRTLRGVFLCIPKNKNQTH